MPRGRQLTDQEIGQIVVFKRLGTSNHGIARVLGHSEKIVRAYLLREEVQAPRKRGRQPSKLKVCDARHIFRLAAMQQLLSKNIAVLLLEKTKRFDPVSTFLLHYTTVLRVLRASKYAKFIRRKKSSLLTSVHKKKRVAYAARHRNKYGELEQTIYIDEKKFNLDSPDGCQFYWRDLRKNREHFLSSVAGAVPVVGWNKLLRQDHARDPGLKTGLTEVR